MSKKIFAIFMTCILICSSISAVSFAEPVSTQPEVIKSWVEDFNSYTTPLGKLYSAGDSSAPDCYNNNVPHRGIKHYCFADGWMLGAYKNANQNTFYSQAGMRFEKGRGGKANSDQSLLIPRKYIWPGYVIKNSFGGEPIVLSDGKALAFSFDWYNTSRQANKNHILAEVKINANVDLVDANGAVTTKTLTFATMTANKVTYCDSTVVRAYVDSWNTFNLYLSKDKVIMKASYDTASKELTVPAVSSVSGSSILKVNYAECHMVDQDVSNALGKYTIAGFDNLSVSELSSMPSAIPAANTAYFTSFEGISYALRPTDSYVGGTKQFYDYSQGQNPASDMLMFSLDNCGYDNDAKTKLNVSIEKDHNGDYSIGCLKYESYELDTTANEVAPLSRLLIDNKTSPRAKLGDTVQFSFDIKVDGNPNANSLYDAMILDANFVCGGGSLISIAGDGTVFDSITKTKLAKLDEGTEYSFDTVYELANGGTTAKVYLNGAKILEKAIAADYQEDIWALRLTYKSEKNADNTKYLANIVRIDNLCYQIFDGGVNAFDFNKSASKASNKAIANTNIDFENSTIFPVSKDWTVGDFKELGIENCSVLNEDGTEASDSDSLDGKKLVFVGDYGKAVSYTVSSEGGINVTKDSFVTVCEPLGNTFAASAKEGSLITAKAVKDNKIPDIYIAEYSNSELVGLTIGDGIANYKPKKAGNKIRVFIWNDNTLVPAFTGAATELNVN